MPEALPRQHIPDADAKLETPGYGQRPIGRESHILQDATVRLAAKAEHGDAAGSAHIPKLDTPIQYPRAQHSACAGERKRSNGNGIGRSERMEILERSAAVAQCAGAFGRLRAGWRWWLGR